MSGMSTEVPAPANSPGDDFIDINYEPISTAPLLEQRSTGVTTQAQARAPSRVTFQPLPPPHVPPTQAAPSQVPTIPAITVVHPPSLVLPVMANLLPIQPTFMSTALNLQPDTVSSPVPASTRNLIKTLSPVLQNLNHQLSPIKDRFSSPQAWRKVN